jgi:hypothetical protein
VRRRAFVALALAAAVAAPARAQQAPRLADARGIVFVGSSIFHRWTRLESQMAPLPITNVAFDGSVTADMLRMVDSRVIPLRPKVIAYYCGSNDVSLGEPAAAIVGRIVRFIERVSAALPDTHVVFVSINRAPSKEIAGMWLTTSIVRSRCTQLPTHASSTSTSTRCSSMPEHSRASICT